jgi:MFS transporter, ACS family, tartrate transporter
LVKIMGKSSDRRNERRLHASVPLFAAAVFFACTTIPGQPFPLTMLWLVLTGSLLWAWTPAFWVLPTLTLGESAAATSLGFINSVGNLGGFVGPAWIGYLLAKLYSHALTTLICSISLALGGVLIFSLSVTETPLSHGAIDTAPAMEDR